MAGEATSKPKRTTSAADAKRLPDAELEVMACLWQEGPRTAREVREIMADYRPMTHGSMVTLLKRLEAKKWVEREKGPVGKAFVYRALRRPGPTHRRIVRNLVRRVFGGSGVALISTLLDSQPPTPNEMEKLEQLFQELRAKADQGEDRG